VDALLIREDVDTLGDMIASTGRTLITIFITHRHGDHFFGSDRLIARFPGVVGENVRLGRLQLPAGLVNTRSSSEDRMVSLVIRDRPTFLSPQNLPLIDVVTVGLYAGSSERNALNMVTYVLVASGLRSRTLQPNAA